MEQLLLHLKNEQHELAALKRLVKHYKSLTKNKKPAITITWETQPARMNFAGLHTRLIGRLLSPLNSNLIVVFLNLNKVIERNCAHPNRVFPKNDLWKNRDPLNMARLLHFIEKGHSLIPPIVRPMANQTLSIIDGYHRIALCRYMGLEYIPFIIDRENLRYCKGLT